jgi:hypothetical protein
MEQADRPGRAEPRMLPLRTGTALGRPGKPSFFRAPPRAVELLVLFGVDCVTLANNHALDYGVDALADMLDHLAAAGIATVGAGAGLHQARRPATRAPAGCGPRSSGSPTIRPTSPPAPTARGRLRRPRPPGARVAAGLGASRRRRRHPGHPPLGPNVTTAPVRHVRRGGAALVAAGVTLVAGHSAHVPHGVAGRSCTTWATSWTTTGLTRDCATTSGCCSWSPWTRAARSVWRRSPEAGVLPQPPGHRRGCRLDAAQVSGRLRNPWH